MATRIVFLDCDGTLTTVKSSWEYLHRRLSLWTDKADEYQALFKQGKIDYHEFCRKDAFLWKGLPVRSVEAVVHEIPYQAGARDLILYLKAAGVITVIISTGISLLVEKVKRELSIDLSFSNDLFVTKDSLSGEIGINVDYDMKGPIVREVLGRFGLSFDDASAIGDGEGDKGMFEEVRLPVGLNINGNSANFPRRTIRIEHLSEAKSLLGVGR